MTLIAPLPWMQSLAPTSERERLARLSDLLRNARRNLSVNTASLGDAVRLPDRVGKAVSQEEAAEAIGISRVWYALLENGQRLPSPELIERICHTLMLDEEQSLAAIELAAASHWQRSVGFREATVLESSSRIKRTAKRLLSASTVDEALTVAAEDLASNCDDAKLVFFVHRVAAGRWTRNFVVDCDERAIREECYNDLVSSLAPERVDEIFLYPTLSEPGAVGTVESYKNTSVGPVYQDALAKFKLRQWALLHGRIRSRGSVIGGITVQHTTSHVYSAAERALISGISLITSLALE